MKPERKRRSAKLEVPREGEPESTSTLVGGAASPNTSHATLRESWSQVSLPSTVSQISTGNRRMSSTDTEEYSRQSSRSDNYMSPERYRSPVRTPEVSSSQLPDLKPLPNQRYGVMQEWAFLLFPSACMCTCSYYVMDFIYIWYVGVLRHREDVCYMVTIKLQR